MKRASPLIAKIFLLLLLLAGATALLVYRWRVSIASAMIERFLAGSGGAGNEFALENIDLEHLGVSSFRFNRNFSGKEVTVSGREAELRYVPSKLAARTGIRLLLPTVEVGVLSQGSSAAKGPVEIQPLLASAMKFLSQLPFEEVQLGNLQFHWKGSPTEITAHAGGSLKQENGAFSIELRGELAVASDDPKSGIVLTDIHLKARATPVPQKLQLDSVTAGIFGGQVAVDPVALAHSEQLPPITFLLRGVDLAQIAALYRQERLSVTGRVDGRLPMTLEAGEILIENGEITSLPPGGVIRYQGDSQEGLTQGLSDQSLALVLEALRNYQYRSLQAGVQYGATGDLRLHLVSKGSNPDLQGGREINLNINLEENIPALLKSLSIVSDISKGIERGAF